MKKRTEDLSEKLIDCHTHCSGMDFYNTINGAIPTTQSITNLKQTIKENAVDFAITFPFPNTLFYDISEYLKSFNFKPSHLCKLPFEIENRNLVEQIEHFETESILPFMGFSLNAYVSEQVENLKALNERHEIYGLKYHTFCDQHTALDILQHPKLIHFLEDNNLPLLIHSGKDAMTSAVNIYKLAEKLPNIRICAAHIGRFSEDFFEILSRHPLPNLYVDLCPFLSLYNNFVKNKETNKKIFKIDKYDTLNVLRYLHEILPNNLIWGTDFPYNYTAKPASNEEKHITSYQDEVTLLKKLETPIVKKIASQNTIDFMFGKRQHSR